ncbi:Metallo-hydrolase/oxidoreductase [Lentinus brumalis]|uniref:Metallo-hydrolase/oxidoreductase n=1 Tax=Lentinus brumalis TaxID=2498619 RepID=A0A371D680_9APHY|nr:Metallo-hydrolase/oxidoreductase [Polyporus brumalis]
MSLPPPAPNQTFCRVSALEAGHAIARLAWIVDGVDENVKADLPVLCFLVQHPTNGQKFLFDLGIRKDWDTGLPAHLVQWVINTLRFETRVPLDIVESLAKGDAKPSDITHVCISHIHFDHIGHSALFPTSKFLAGEGARFLVENGYPKVPESVFPVDTFPEGRTTFLNPEGWPALGPFPHALDFYGDGSLYIVDAGHGHIPGHLNLLVRTSADGGWIYCAADSVHDWSLLTGDAKIGRHPIFGCTHHDVGAAEEHIARVKTLMKENPRLKVILAHDAPWYRENKDGPAFWPGAIESL